jgi:hypothetical protein
MTMLTTQRLAATGREAASFWNGNPDTMGLFAYVGNDPANRVDPTGQFWLPPEGSASDRRFLAGGAQLGRQIADSPTKVDDAVLLGTVAVMAGGSIVAAAPEIAGGSAVAAGKGLGNPFKGKSPEQVAKMMERKGFTPRGPNPAGGKGGYVNPKTGRSYHIDRGQRPAPRKSEPAHVDVNRDSTLTKPTPDLPKRKFPLEEK